LKNLTIIKSERYSNFSKEKWDSVVNQFYGSIFYSYSYVEYLKLCNKKNLIDNCSFIIFKNNEPMAVILLFVEKQGVKKQISIGNNTIQSPLYNPLLNKKDFKIIHEYVIDKIHEIASKNKCDLARFQISGFNFLEDKKNYINFYQDYGFNNKFSEKNWYLFKCNKALILNLSKKKDLIYQNIRTSYKSLINKTRQNTSLEILDQNNLDENLFEKYGIFHNLLKKNKRSSDNLKFNFNLIKEGKETIFLCLFNNEIIGSMVVLSLNKKAYINSICKIEDDIKVYPIHYLFWSSIEYFLNKKYKYFWIGEKANKNIKNLSDIEKNLSFFKEGWGGEEAQWTQVEKKFYE